VLFVILKWVHSRYIHCVETSGGLFDYRLWAHYKGPPLLLVDTFSHSWAFIYLCALSCHSFFILVMMHYNHSTIPHCSFWSAYTLIIHSRRWKYHSMGLQYIYRYRLRWHSCIDLIQVYIHDWRRWCRQRWCGSPSITHLIFFYIHSRTILSFLSTHSVSGYFLPGGVRAVSPPPIRHRHCWRRWVGRTTLRPSLAWRWPVTWYAALRCGGDDILRGRHVTSVLVTVHTAVLVNKWLGWYHYI